MVRLHLLGGQSSVFVSCFVGRNIILGFEGSACGSLMYTAYLRTCTLEREDSEGEDAEAFDADGPYICMGILQPTK